MTTYNVRIVWDATLKTHLIFIEPTEVYIPKRLGADDTDES